MVFAQITQQFRTSNVGSTAMITQGLHPCKWMPQQATEVQQRMLPTARCSHCSPKKDEIKQETYKRDLSAPLSLEAAEAASEKSRAAVFLRPDPPFPSQSRGRWLAGLLSDQCSAARLHQTDAELRFLAASEEHQRKRQSELGSGTWGIGLISLRRDVASFCTVHVPLIADVAL